MPIANHYVLWIAAAYLLICGVLGIVGRHRKLGGWAYFFASICLTPLLGVLLLMASDPRHRRG
ncbi:MAG: hypothetical protein HRU33_04275 [Rhodobacteraceae bacterium]|nr:hypothetical protein [Paracoccaceae bacterium]